MSRALWLLAVAIALAGCVAAEFASNVASADHDVSDLLFKVLSEQQDDSPKAVTPQRALLGARALAAVYPPSPVPRVCFKPATSNGDKYRVEIWTYNRYIKNFSQIQDLYVHFYLNRWPTAYRLPDVTPFQNRPLFARGAVFTRWRFAVRVYLTPCPRNAREQAYKEHIRRRAKSKLLALKHKSIYRIRLF